LEGGIVINDRPQISELCEPTPLTFSLYIGQRLVNRAFSPVSYLLFPVLSIRFPYSFFVIVLADLLKTLTIKWSLVHADRYNLLNGRSIQACPDHQAWLEMFGQPSVEPPQASRETSGQSSTEVPMVTSLLDPHRPVAFDTPVFPKDLDLVLQTSSPLANERFSTLFEIDLVESKGYPRFFIPLLSFILHFLLTMREKYAGNPSSND